LKFGGAVAQVFWYSGSSILDTLMLILYYSSEIISFHPGGGEGLRINLKNYPIFVSQNEIQRDLEP